MKTHFSDPEFGVRKVTCTALFDPESGVKKQVRKPKKQGPRDPVFWGMKTQKSGYGNQVSIPHTHMSEFLNFQEIKKFVYTQTYTYYMVYVHNVGTYVPTYIWACLGTQVPGYPKQGAQMCTTWQCTCEFGHMCLGYRRYPRHPIANTIGAELETVRIRVQTQRRTSMSCRHSLLCLQNKKQI